VPYALPAVCLDISSAEAQLGQVHATRTSQVLGVIQSDRDHTRLFVRAMVPVKKHIMARVGTALRGQSEAAAGERLISYLLDDKALY
jgi:hypothetical protein